MQSIQFGTFQSILNMWTPIISMIDQNKAIGEIAQMGEFLADETVKFHVKMIECINSGTSFQDDDLFEEHLDNPHGIKEILLCVNQVTTLKPAKLLTFIQ